MQQNPAHVQSVDKALKLLDCLAAARKPLSLQEIAQATGWAKSTIYGLLSTMREHAVVEQSKTDGKYRLGVRLFELGSVVGNLRDIRVLARPYLQNIALQTGESVHIGMLDRGEVMYLDTVDSNMALRVVAEAGMRLPVHCSALGKAMLAYLPEAQVKSILQTHGMPSFTPHTITTQQAMEEELAKIRDNGFSLENGEMRIGMRCVAAPVFDAEGVPSYAIGVTGMMRRVMDEAVVLAQKLVVEAAKAISSELAMGSRLS